MTAVTLIFAFLAALLHVLFFLMESVFYMNPKVHRNFGVRRIEDAQTLKLTMFNQGFYNLFLSAGIFAGMYLLQTDHIVVGKTLILFCCTSMFLAAVVLFVSKPNMLKGVFIQGLCPLIALVSYFLANKGVNL
jgi:putative membrane protein